MTTKLDKPVNGEDNSDDNTGEKKELKYQKRISAPGTV